MSARLLITPNPGKLARLHAASLHVLERTGLQVENEATPINHARMRQPFLIAPAVMGGISGPMTLAGAFAQQNAEVLAGIVLVQAIGPGTPVVCGDVTTVSDSIRPSRGRCGNALCESRRSPRLRSWKTGHASSSASPAAPGRSEMDQMAQMDQR